jgi:stearoyl-CoA desaturase (delta-9 desaturase)
MLLHTVLYVFVTAPLINGLGHWSGQQTFANTAYNRPVLAVVTAGEGLHNNHHAHPGVARFSLKRLEWDPAWALIRILSAASWLRIKCSSPGEFVNSRLAGAGQADAED